MVTGVRYNKSLVNIRVSTDFTSFIIYIFPLKIMLFSLDMHVKILYRSKLTIINMGHKKITSNEPISCSLFFENLI